MGKSGYILGGMEELTQHAETQKTNVFWTLVYIREGIGMYLLESNLRTINQGDLLIFPPKVSYSFCEADLGDEYNVNIDAVVLRFDNAWLNDLLSVFKSMNGVVLKIREMERAYAVAGPKWMKISSLLNEISVAGTTRQAMIILELLELISSPKDLICLLDSPLPESLNLQERKDRIDRYVETNLYHKVSLEDVASYLGMNRTYFCQFFKKQYGKGFSDYLNDIRIDKAAAMLLQGDRNIIDIAKECGFKTAPYFTRAFRRSRGMTPGEYRKKHEAK